MQSPHCRGSWLCRLPGGLLENHLVSIRDVVEVFDVTFREKSFGDAGFACPTSTNYDADLPGLIFDWKLPDKMFLHFAIC